MFLPENAKVLPRSEVGAGDAGVRGIYDLRLGEKIRNSCLVIQCRLVRDFDS